MADDSPLPRLSDVRLGEYDFLDFGAGAGASIERAQDLFGGRGLGIDIDASKVIEARSRGHEVVLGDPNLLPRRPLVRYVMMDNVLEHLPSLSQVNEMIRLATRVAREFIFIRHPSFEDEAYLRALGLKQYWHDWTGHPSHVLVSDFVTAFRDAGCRAIELDYRYPARDSSAPEILPIDAPPDQHQYDERLHGRKPLIEFAKPVHRQLWIKVPIGFATSAGRRTLRGLLRGARAKRGDRTLARS